VKPATLRANSPMAACSGSIDSSLAVSGPRLDYGHYFGGLGSAAAADLPSAGLCVAICPGPGLASRSLAHPPIWTTEECTVKGPQNRRQAKAPTSAVRHNNKINYWRLMTRSFLAVLMILL
jgi:hypothetical protein